VSKTVQPTSKAADVSAASEAQTGQATASPSRFKVTLKANTPLLHKTLVVAADTHEAARKAFCAANGISGSKCEWLVEPTNEPVTELKK